MRNLDRYKLSLAILQKRAFYQGGMQNAGGAVSALASPWIGKQVKPGMDFLKSINPGLEHAETIWNGGGGQPAPKLPVPAVPTSNYRAPSMPSMSSMQPNSSVGAPSFLPAPQKMAMMGRIGGGLPTPASVPPPGAVPKPMVGMMTGPSLPASAQSLHKPIGAQHRVPPGLASSFGRSHRWMSGAGAGSGNSGAMPSMGPSFTAPAGGSTVGPGSSAGTTGGGDSGAAGQK